MASTPDLTAGQPTGSMGTKSLPRYPLRGTITASAVTISESDDNGARGVS